MLLSASLAIIKVPGHSRLSSLENNGNHHANVSTKNAVLKGTNNQTSVMVQRDFPAKRPSRKKMTPINK